MEIIASGSEEVEKEKSPETASGEGDDGMKVDIPQGIFFLSIS